jgi:hypothetical protein
MSGRETYLWQKENEMVEVFIVDATLSSEVVLKGYSKSFQ